MKFKFTFAILCCTFFLSSVFAQDKKDEPTPIDKFLKDSRDYYKEKKFQFAAASLQEAINHINELVGKSILLGLPSELNGMRSLPENDNTTSLGTLMGAGMTVNRIYQNEKGGMLTVSITPNSPQVSGLETFLNNPQDYGTENGAGKSIKIGEYKALCNFKRTEEEATAYLQMAMGNNLIAFSGDGFTKEEDFVNAVKAIDYTKLSKSLGATKAKDKEEKQ